MGTDAPAQLLRTQLRGDQVIVVSNREPYIHDKGDDGIDRAASRRAAW